MHPMRRISFIVVAALAVGGCGLDLYESPDFGTVDAGDEVVMWRLAQGPGGFVGVGGPIQPEDLAEDAGPLSLRSYRSPDGRTWEPGEALGSIAAPLLGLTASVAGYAASGVWDGAPAVLVSGDGLTWERFELPTTAGTAPSIESAGIAAAGDVVVVTGFDTEAGSAPLVWRHAPDTGPILLDRSGFPAATRFTQAIAGPAGFVVAAIGTTEASAPPPIWVSDDGLAWDPVFDPFDGETVVTGLIGSATGYVAVVAEAGSDEHFTLWTSDDGVNWANRADQNSVFGYLGGKSGDLITDLSGSPGSDARPRPIAFSFNGRWLEITEAVGGERFVPVAVASDEVVRLISGFVGGDRPAPLVLVAGA
jgi:hypothetical protein